MNWQKKLLYISNVKQRKLLEKILNNCELDEITEFCINETAHLKLGIDYLISILYLQKTLRSNILAKFPSFKVKNEIATISRAILTLEKKIANLPLEDKQVLKKVFNFCQLDAGVIIIASIRNLFRLEKKGPSKKYIKLSNSIYLSIIERVVGNRRIYCQMSDATLKASHPKEYYKIARGLKLKKKRRDLFLKKIEREIKTALLQQNKLDLIFVGGRVKNIHSIWTKMKKKKRFVTELHDLFGIRIITSSKKDCYIIYKMLRKTYHECKKDTVDYIKNPRDLYRALHCVMIILGNKVEIQIKTLKMHKEAEFGLAAHWRYKKGISNKELFAKIKKWRKKLRSQKDFELFFLNLKTLIEKEKSFIMRDLLKEYRRSLHS